jgi:MFS family permease
MDVVLDVTTPASELPAPKPITVLGSMIEEYGLGRYQRGLIVLLGMVLMGDGMEMYVPSLVVPELPADWELGSIEKGLLGSGAAFGMWIASAFMGSLSDQFGRTPVLSAASAVAFLAAALCAVAETWVQWLLLRILFGVGVGSILPITIVMLNECVASRLLARVIALTWLFGGETPSWATVAGGLAVLAALAYNEVGQSRRPAAAA